MIESNEKDLLKVNFYDIKQFWISLFPKKKKKKRKKKGGVFIVAYHMGRVHNNDDLRK